MPASPHNGNTEKNFGGRPPLHDKPLVPLKVSVREKHKELAEEIGANRSEGARMVFEFYLEHHGD